MLGYELRNWLAQSDALVSHKTSPPQSDMVDGRLGFHMPITCEYANSPIWACGCYHRSRAVPIWLTQYWVDMTCNPPASNECDDATSPKTLTNRLWIGANFMGSFGLLVSASYKPIASTGGEWRRGYEVGQSGARALTGYSFGTHILPANGSKRHQNPESVTDWWIC